MAHSERTEDVLALGSEFAAYTIESCIGEGGMARVYRARHEALQRDVALKVMTLGSGDRDGAERFLREARMAAAIKHRNVVNIFDVGLKDGIPFMVMELLVGEDLEARLSKGAPLPDGEIVDMAVPVAGGLAAVHDAGIIHRDLKPGNIFLSAASNGEFEAKLLDFGISKSLAHQAGTESANAPLMGTPLYMAPEVLLGRELTPKSDQYSLGVVLYECATGVNPFIADTMDEVMQKVALGDVTPVSQQNPALPKALARIIERAMRRDPAERFPDMRAMGRELLLLAGQRTRITWGLTFGEVGLSVVPHEVSLSESDVGSRRPSERGLGARLRSAAPTTGLLAALAVAAISTGRFWAPVDPQGAAAPAEPARVRTASIPEAASAPESSSPTAGVLAASQAAGEHQPMAEAGAKPAVVAEAPAAPKEVLAKVRPARTPRRVARAVTAAVTTGPSESERQSVSADAPEWALSAHVPRARSANVGTNNAPILE